MLFQQHSKLIITEHYFTLIVCYFVVPNYNFFFRTFFNEFPFEMKVFNQNHGKLSRSDNAASATHAVSVSSRHSEHTLEIPILMIEANATTSSELRNIKREIHNAKHSN